MNSPKTELRIGPKSISVLVLSLLIIAMLLAPIACWTSYAETLFEGDGGVMGSVFGWGLFASVVMTNIFCFINRYDVAKLFAFISTGALFLSAVSIILDSWVFSFSHLNWGFFVYLMVVVVILVLVCLPRKE